jgi:hypothetical protein
MKNEQKKHDEKQNTKHKQGNVYLSDNNNPTSAVTAAIMQQYIYVE